MAQIFDIQRVDVGLENLMARVRVANDAPLMTSEDLVGTTRIYNLMPHIIDHVCLGDAGETFKDAMGHTELAHLLEHMTVELLSQSSAAADVTSGRTYPVSGDPRLFDVELSCNDDVLVVGALASAVWIATWAYGGGGSPEPDVEAIVAGLTNMVRGLGEGPEVAYRHTVETELKRAFDEEYQRLLAERELQIAEREQEIAEARAAAQAEAEELMAAERARIEEEARRKAEEAAAAAAALRPAWAVDLERYEAEERERREQAEAAREAAEAAAQAAAEQEASERAALGAQQQVREDEGDAESENGAEDENGAESENGAEELVETEAVVESSVEEDLPDTTPCTEAPDSEDATEGDQFASQLSDIFRSQPDIDPLLELRDQQADPASAETEEPVVAEPSAELAAPAAQEEEPAEEPSPLEEEQSPTAEEDVPEVEEPAADEAPAAADAAEFATSSPDGGDFSSVVEHIPQARRVR